MKKINYLITTIDDFREEIDNRLNEDQDKIAEDVYQLISRAKPDQEFYPTDMPSDKLDEIKNGEQEIAKDYYKDILKREPDQFFDEFIEKLNEPDYKTTEEFDDFFRKLIEPMPTPKPIKAEEEKPPIKTKQEIEKEIEKIREKIAKL